MEVRNQVKPDAMPSDSTAVPLPETDALPEAAQDRLARILDDYLVAMELGTPITPDELLARHPEDASHLRMYLSGLQLFHAAAATPSTLPGVSFFLAQSPAQIGQDKQFVREPSLAK